MDENAAGNPVPDDAHSEWEPLINALIDGELDAAQHAALLAQAEREPTLQRELDRARQLQQALHQLPSRQAPLSLRFSLQQIGLQQIGREKAGPNSGFPDWWRWGAIAAAVPLLLFTLYPGQQAPSAAEIEQGRRDLVVALGYLQGASDKAILKIDDSLIGGVVDPIKENTVRALQSRIRMQEELSL